MGNDKIVKRDKKKDRYCQDCKHYKRPMCRKKLDFTARKNTCKDFSLK